MLNRRERWRVGEIEGGPDALPVRLLAHGRSSRHELTAWRRQGVCPVCSPVGLPNHEPRHTSCFEETTALWRLANSGRVPVLPLIDGQAGSGGSSWSGLLPWWPAVQHFGLHGKPMGSGLLVLLLLDLLPAVGRGADRPQKSAVSQWLVMAMRCEGDGLERPQGVHRDRELSSSTAWAVSRSVRPATRRPEFVRGSHIVARVFPRAVPIRHC